jgi:hypothetical protein
MAHATAEQQPAMERRSSHLLATTQRTLWPLVKLLLHRGIGYPGLSEALKAVFVGVAESEFPLESKRETDSRISLLTGIHRRDVKRLRDAMRERRAAAAGATALRSDTPGSTEASLSARVAAVWTGLPGYLDERGAPLPLPRLARRGGERSFESLVQSVNKDTRPRALLDEWLRRGAVTIDEQDRVHLNLEMFMATRALDESAFRYGQNIHDHVAAIVHNLTGEQPPLLEDAVSHTELTEAAAAELAELAYREGLRALQTINRRALELKARDAGNPMARTRINFGLYFFGATGRARAVAGKPEVSRPLR